MRRFGIRFNSDNVAKKRRRRNLCICGNHKNHQGNGSGIQLLFKTFKKAGTKFNDSSINVVSLKPQMRRSGIRFNSNNVAKKRRRRNLCICGNHKITKETALVYDLPISIDNGCSPIFCKYQPHLNQTGKQQLH